MQHAITPPYTRFLLSHPVGGGSSSSSKVERTRQHEKGEKEDDPPKIELMRYEHVSKVSDTLDAAFLKDPQRHYTRDTPDSKGLSKFQNKIARLQQSLYMADLARQKMIFVIRGGDAMAVFVGAPSKTHKNKWDKLIAKLLTAISKFGTHFDTPEQKRRGEEFMRKYIAVINASLGDRLPELTMCGGLATTPAQQGKGYGGRLIDFITSKADADGRAMYLGSSNLANTEFYESHGFVEVGSFLLGDDNPTWKEPPVKMLVMLREPKFKF